MSVVLGRGREKDVFVARDRARDGELPRFENSRNVEASASNMPGSPEQDDGFKQRALRAVVLLF